MKINNERCKIIKIKDTGIIISQNDLFIFIAAENLNKRMIKAKKTLETTNELLMGISFSRLIFLPKTRPHVTVHILHFTKKT